MCDGFFSIHRKSNRQEKKAEPRGQHILKASAKQIDLRDEGQKFQNWILSDEDDPVLAH